jgi:hypothetical protein
MCSLFRTLLKGYVSHCSDLVLLSPDLLLIGNMLLMVAAGQVPVTVLRWFADAKKCVHPCR